MRFPTAGDAAASGGAGLPGPRPDVPRDRAQSGHQRAATLMVLSASRRMPVRNRKMATAVGEGRIQITAPPTKNSAMNVVPPRSWGEPRPAGGG